MSPHGSLPPGAGDPIRDLTATWLTGFSRRKASRWRRTRQIFVMNTPSNARSNRLHARQPLDVIGAVPARHERPHGSTVLARERRSVHLVHEERVGMERLVDRDALRQGDPGRGEGRLAAAPTMFLPGTGCLMMRQIGALAHFTVRRILASEHLFEVFRNEDRIDQFWALPDHELVAPFQASIGHHADCMGRGPHLLNAPWFSYLPMPAGMATGTFRRATGEMVRYRWMCESGPALSGKLLVFRT